MTSLSELGPIAVVGAGPAGSLLAIYLAQRGHTVELFESRSDLRAGVADSGRSINLALATRGIVALEAAGLAGGAAGISIPMDGRLIHAEGDVVLQPYGAAQHERIYSINRADLNAVLLDAAERTGLVNIHFQHRLQEVDLDARRLVFDVRGSDGGTEERSVSFGVVFGADGVNSQVRRATVQANGGDFEEVALDHGYKELTIAAAEDGGFRIDPNALHIWPRGDFMLIALPNPAGDFTATLFLPNEARIAAELGSFEELDSVDSVKAFFTREFPGFMELVPDLVDQFFQNPTGDLSTIRVSNWSHDDASTILGDSAHGIVPFHGQGMNAAMESALRLTEWLDKYPNDIKRALSSYSNSRRPNTDAIADMALDNYIEMRSSVIDRRYLLKRELALELQRRHPDRMFPRYGMVMFTTLPYAEVVERDAQQSEILATLLDGVESLDRVDFEAAATLLDRLPMLSATAIRPVNLETNHER